MKIGFFGTPEIASYCLKELAGKHSIRFAVTPEDKKYGRNQQLKSCQGKDAALAMNVPVLQPDDLSDPAFLEEISCYDADIYVVVAYGKIIPGEVFNHPPLKTINLHPSLLPKYRGAAPIQWALINGESESGVSVQLINERMDAGDIVIQETVSLSDDLTAEGLYELVLPAGARLLDKAINLLASKEAVLLKQNEDDVTFCKKIDRDTAHVDWNGRSKDIHNLVRGLNPKPAAWTTFRGKNLKLWETALPDDEPDFKLKPGEIARFQKKRLIAGTGDGFIELINIQPETKKRMDGMSFINGYRITEGEFME